MFVNDIFGGAIPRQYVPAVEKGIRESAARGFLAGYPVVDIKVTVFDGSYHDVDSSEMSFKMAARLAFRKCMEQAKPALLEPIMSVEIEAPDEFAGALMGDLNGRRGRVQGMESAGCRNHRPRRGPHGRDAQLRNHPHLHDPGPRQLPHGDGPLRRRPPTPSPKKSSPPPNDPSTTTPKTDSPSPPHRVPHVIDSFIVMSWDDQRTPRHHALKYLQPTHGQKSSNHARHKNPRTHKIAVIPGDGIGKEVVPEGIRVLEAAAKKFNFNLQLDEFDFASCDYYLKHGKMLPDDWKEQIGRHDAIFFGAVGWPEKVPDHISLWGSLIQFRREFDQYVNLRPVRLMPGVPCPLADRKPGDIDFFVVRENTEGEYSSIGGRIFPGTDREVVVQETVMTRIGVDRILKFAFELAQTRARRSTSPPPPSPTASPSRCRSGTSGSQEMSKAFPDVPWDKYHIDILTAHFVLNPDCFDVVVASNLFGDILSDLGPACAGTIGIAPSGNINPNAGSRRCSNPSTAPPRTSPARASPIPSARSGRRR